MNHLIVSLKPVLASIIEQGIAQDLILCADPVSLAEIVLIVLTVKMDNTLVPSTADEIEQTISALVSLLEKGTENPAWGIAKLSDGTAVSSFLFAAPALHNISHHFESLTVI